MGLVRELIDAWRYDKQMGELSVKAQFTFGLLASVGIMLACLSPLILDWLT